MKKAVNPRNQGEALSSKERPWNNLQDSKSKNWHRKRVESAKKREDLRNITNKNQNVTFIRPSCSTISAKLL